jgi:hypothetical protein
MACPAILSTQPPEQHEGRSEALRVAPNVFARGPTAPGLPRSPSRRLSKTTFGGSE